MANIKEAATNSQQPSRTLMIDSLANLDTIDCPLRPSLPNLSCSIRRWRQTKNQAPPIPPKGNGDVIPDGYKFLENGENFNTVWLRLAR